MGYKFLILLCLCTVVFFTIKQSQNPRNLPEKSVVLNEDSLEINAFADTDSMAKASFEIEIYGDTLRLDTMGNAIVPVGRNSDSGSFFNLKLIHLKNAGTDSLLFENGQYFFGKVLPLTPSLHGGLASSFVLYILKEKSSKFQRIYISERSLEGFRALSPALPLESWGFAGKNRLVFNVKNDTASNVYQYNFSGNSSPKLLSSSEVSEASIVNALKIKSN